MSEQVAVPGHLLPLLRAVEAQCRNASAAYAKGMSDALIILARAMSVVQPEKAGAEGTESYGNQNGS